MSDEYLWDRSGEPDPEIQKLERALSPLAHDGEPLKLEPGKVPEAASVTRESDRSGAAVIAGPARRGDAARGTRWRPLAWQRGLAVAASFAVLAGAAAWLKMRATPAAAPGTGAGWAVERLEGTPRAARGRIEETGQLAEGDWLTTDSRSRARVHVGEIGYVEIEPRTRVRLVRANGVEHRLALDHGALEAVIVAPPRTFVVDTPSATTFDLGCAYRLAVDERGRGLVEVHSGWVSFEHQGREAFIPAGASCETRPGIGPGTPWQSDAQPALRAALVRLDFEGAPDADLDRVLALSRAEDALTLWHLLARFDGARRERVFDRFVALVPPPATVTRAAVLRGDRAALDAWWGALGYGDVDWWRLWQHQWPDAGV